MKKFLLKTFHQLKPWLVGKESPTQVHSSPDPRIITKINQALTSQATVHIISTETDFTGRIVKHDPRKEQLIAQSISGTITMIVDTKGIRKLSVLPISISDNTLTTN